MTGALLGKRVLLIAPRFFGYDQDIGREIERQGAKVDRLADRPFDTPLMSAITRLKPEWVQPAADRLYQRELEALGAARYDIVLVLNGQTVSTKTLSYLRTSFPSARFILYMWDSLENRPTVIKNLPLFDTTFSFDPLNCEQFGLNLRPLFFSPGFERPPAEHADYHLSFVGTAHTDRYSIVKKIDAGLGPEIKRYWYLYLQAPWVYYAYKLGKSEMRNAQRKDFSFVPLQKSALQSIFSNSRAVVDIEHPQQRGLTMRTFETMGAHKKLITTNIHVRETDFFALGNIMVVDRAQPHVSPEFLATPAVAYPPEIYRRYSIRGWVNEVLNLEPRDLKND